MTWTAKQTPLLQKHLAWRNKCFLLTQHSEHCTHLCPSMEGLKLQLYLCKFWDWRKRGFHVTSSALEIAPDLSPGLFSHSGKWENYFLTGKPLFSFTSFQELKEGMESRSEVSACLCVVIIGYGMKGMLRNMLLRISKVIDWVHINFYK